VNLRQFDLNLLVALDVLLTGGQIHEVEAVGIFVPYASPTGWE
jgi:hypothetical protein